MPTDCWDDWWINDSVSRFLVLYSSTVLIRPKELENYIRVDYIEKLMDYDHDNDIKLLADPQQKNVNDQVRL